MFDEHLLRGTDASAGIDHVIVEDGSFACDLSDNVEDFRFLMLWPGLMHDREVRSEYICEFLRRFRSSFIRRDDDGILQFLRLEVVNENLPGIQRVHRDIEKSLNLIGMEREGDDMVCPCGCDQICNELRGNRFPWR